MNKEYHISLNGKNLGMFSLDQLQESKIDPESLVWYEGLDDWKPVINIDELKAYIKSTPPPIPKESRKKTVQTPVYLILGIIGLALTYWLSDSGFINALYQEGGYRTALVLITIRLFICISIYNTMKEYKREPLSWALLGFLFPSITLICAAFVKPFKKKPKKHPIGV